jgi:nitroreductase
MATKGAVMSRIFASTPVQPSVVAVSEALARAAAIAGSAPSIHNTQPWRWQVGDAALDLYLAPERRLDNTDPDGRLAVISCGAALHHARTALAAEGWRVEVVPMPDPADPTHLAHVTVFDRQEANPESVRQARAIEHRHTDRRPATGTVPDEGRVLAVTVAIEDEGCWLHLLPRDRILELAAAMSYAQNAEFADEAWRHELAAWTGTGRPADAGVPDAVIPDRPTPTTVPSRDFGRTGSQPVTAGHDEGALFAIIYGPQDGVEDWLRAGQALSAAWLTATELGLAIQPLSAAVEVPATRQVLRRLLSGIGQPYLALRLSTARPGLTGTPRLPADRTVERRPL